MYVGYLIVIKSVWKLKLNLVLFVLLEHDETVTGYTQTMCPKMWCAIFHVEIYVDYVLAKGSSR